MSEVDPLAALQQFKAAETTKRKDTPEISGEFERLHLQAAATEAESKLGTSAIAPDFTLNDHQGRAFHLHEYIRHGPVILVFDRGTWYPYFASLLKSLQPSMPTLSKMHCTLAAIAPQSANEWGDFKLRNGVDCVTLCDPDARVASQFGLTFTASAEVLSLYQSSYGINPSAISLNFGSASSASSSSQSPSPSPSSTQFPISSIVIVGSDSRVKWFNINRDTSSPPSAEEIIAQAKLATPPSQLPASRTNSSEVADHFEFSAFSDVKFDASSLRPIADTDESTVLHPEVSYHPAVRVSTMSVSTFPPESKSKSASAEGAPPRAMMTSTKSPRQQVATTTASQRQAAEPKKRRFFCF